MEPYSGVFVGERNLAPTADNTQEKDAPHYLRNVVASLLSPDESTLRDIYNGRKRRLFLAGRYAQLPAKQRRQR